MDPICKQIILVAFYVPKGQETHHDGLSPQLNGKAKGFNCMLIIRLRLYIANIKRIGTTLTSRLRTNLIPRIKDGRGPHSQLGVEKTFAEPSDL